MGNYKTKTIIVEVVTNNTIHFMAKNLRMHNEDIPQETILRDLMEENKRLRHELGFMKQKLDNRETAIKAFKKWQASVASFKYNYWLNEGIRLMDEQPAMSEVKALRTIIGKHTTYKSWYDKCYGVAQKMQEAKGVLSNKHNETKKMELLNNGQQN